MCASHSWQILFSPLQNLPLYDTFMAMVTKRQKQNTVKKTQTHKQDTGSPEVQIGILTKKIEELAKHLKSNKKDVHSRRGLLQMVADRQKHMRYLRKKSPSRMQEVAEKLNLKQKK